MPNNVSHSITLQINLEILKFLKQCKKKHLSLEQKILMETIEGIYKDLSELKKQSFEFTANNEAEILRGSFYAVTELLQEIFSSLKKISLADLQKAFENELHINNKETLSYIILCLVEPIWLPGRLPGPACILLPSDKYSCSNQSASKSNFAYTLKAKPYGNEGVLFHMTLPITAIHNEAKPIIGTTHIQFIIDNAQQVKLLPIQMQIDFPDENELKQFQDNLTANFKGWLLHQEEFTKLQIKLHQAPILTMDLCLLPILVGLLIGLIAMINFTALSLIIISPLILPPIGLALGFCLATFMLTCVHIGAKKDQEKLKRPIHIVKNPVAPLCQAALFNLNYSRPLETNFSRLSR